MSDHIPFEIQMEIIKKVANVKPLIRFRSVSKPWRSFIDSSEFIAYYGARNTQPHSLLLRYKLLDNSSEEKYICFVDDDTLTQHQLDFAVTDAMKQFNDLKVIGSSHGLLCLRSYDKEMLVLWNPSIRKSVRIKLPYFPSSNNFLGFAVCPANNDPTIVMISHPWNVGVFTLSSKRFTMFQYTKLPPKSITPMSSQVVIDSCIYWVARELIHSVDGSFHYSYMIMSFDLIAKEIRLVDIPHSCILNTPFSKHFFISRLRESLVLFVPNEKVQIPVCGVWKMEHDESFTKLFTISTPGHTINKIFGFRKNGELVMETAKVVGQFATIELYEHFAALYKPCSEYINNLGISGEKHSFFMGSYKETLLLLDELDSCVCSDINCEKVVVLRGGSAESKIKNLKISSDSLPRRVVPVHKRKAKKS
nr:hypothetical protein [Tanacetum cinerariifolium]